MMKLAFLTAFVLAPWTGSDHARGLQLMQEGKFAEAAAAFRAAAEADPDNAELHYNLALALWRAGEPHEAEIAAEKAATLSDGRLAALRDGILGNLAMDEAASKRTAQPPDLQGALVAAQRARDHYLHGAAVPQAPTELARNLERALTLMADLEKEIAAQEQQPDEKGDDEAKDEEKKEAKDDKKGDEKDEPKPGDGKDQPKDQPKPDQSKKDDPKEDGKQDPQQADGKAEDGKEQKDPGQDKPPRDPKEAQAGKDDASQGQSMPPPGSGDNKDKPEPKPETAGQSEPQAAQPEPERATPPPGAGTEPQPQPEPGKPPSGKPDELPAPATAVPGQSDPGKELSPEETKRLLDRLQAVLLQKAELEKAQQLARPRVKKDW
jgi:tetratricopeptide (TPR) repeat protein